MRPAIAGSIDVMLWPRRESDFGAPRCWGSCVGVLSVAIVSAACAEASPRPTAAPEPATQTDQPSALAASSSGEVRFVGTIRDLDLGCWADRQCAIRVDDQWVALPSAGRHLADAPEQAPEQAHGAFIGITLHGEPEAALRARYVGRSAEVFARKVAQTISERLARGEGALTLGGKAVYFVRLRDGTP